MIGLHDKARGKWRRHFVAPEIGRAMTQARRGISGRSARLRQPAERGLLRGSGQARPTSSIRAAAASAQVAQLVEQRTENPCVGSSILPLGTIPKSFIELQNFVGGSVPSRPLAWLACVIPA